MGRGSVKIIKQTMGNAQDMQNMFQQMIDPSKADPDVIMPKYEDIKSRVLKIAKLLGMFASAPFLPAVNVDLTELKEYAKEMSHSMEQCDYTRENICSVYGIFKDNLGVQRSLAVCKCLSPYRKSIENKDALDDNFVKDIIAGQRILPCCSFNFPVFWENKHINDESRRFMLNTFSSLFNNSLEIYKHITSPDVDIEKFSEILVNAICEVQKRPELSRCNKAFNKIKNSVELLKGNFSDYYKDFVQSKNPTVIMESFVIDVANAENADPETTRQFRQIITYFKKVSDEKKIKDPQISEVFRTLNEKMSILEGTQTQTSPGTAPPETAPETFPLESNSSDAKVGPVDSGSQSEVAAEDANSADWAPPAKKSNVKSKKK